MSCFNVFVSLIVALIQTEDPDRAHPGAFIFRLTLDQWRDWEEKLDWHLAVWSRLPIYATQACTQSPVYLTHLPPARQMALPAVPEESASLTPNSGISQLLPTKEVFMGAVGQRGEGNKGVQPSLLQEQRRGVFVLGEGPGAAAPQHSTCQLLPRSLQEPVSALESIREIAQKIRLPKLKLFVGEIQWLL
ncbi:hypothetical protein IRJ41_000537 [Triplophysa rosa]|uniref:Uncharacterized protein n=1 Tax=Triplophysa rosa TaxID=992332 RepID=A0A9W7T656_TRIRA|nr:hypothetical protein IRJ41_000537 [Triplophysa rosa]